MKSLVYNFRYIGVFCALHIITISHVFSNTIYAKLDTVSIIKRCHNKAIAIENINQELEKARYNSNFQESFDNCLLLHDKTEELILAYKQLYSSYHDFFNPSTTSPITQFVATSSKRLNNLISNLSVNVHSLNEAFLSENYETINQALSPILRIIKAQQESTPIIPTAWIKLMLQQLDHNDPAIRLLITCILLFSGYDEPGFLCYSTTLLLWYCDQINNDIYTLRPLCIAALHCLIKKLCDIPESMNIEIYTTWRDKKNAIEEGCDTYLHENIIYNNLLIPDATIHDIYIKNVFRNPRYNNAEFAVKHTDTKKTIFNPIQYPDFRRTDNIGSLLHAEIKQLIEITKLMTAINSTMITCTLKISQEQASFRIKRSKRLPPLASSITK